MKRTLLETTIVGLCLCGFNLYGATFTVTSNQDSGPGSLRQAIIDSNAASGDDTISFTIAGTVKLVTALPAITDNTTIAGPGTNVLTISGNDVVRVLTLNAGSTNTISGLTIANGRATGYANGAGIANAGNLTILNCGLSNNQNFGGWGGAVFNSGNLAVFNSTFSGNQVTGENGFDGGATSAPGAGGGAAGLGGGLCSLSGRVIITGCTFTGNNATGGNGGASGNGTGRGGGINGGRGGLGVNDTPGDPGGFGSGGGGGGYAARHAGQGGFGGGGGGGDGAAGYGAGNGGGYLGQQGVGGGGGGGAGMGGGIFVNAGTVTVVDCFFLGNQATGGRGGAGWPYNRTPAGTGGNGSGLGNGLFSRDGDITLQNSTVATVTPSTPLEDGFSGKQPVGTPSVFADGHSAFGQVVKRGFFQLALRTKFDKGTIVYSLDSSDPRSNSILYTGPFLVRKSALLRAVAYDSQFSTSVEMDLVKITILPSLIVNTAGGGTVTIDPPSGPYFSNSVAQVTAQSSTGFTFLQWLGDASGTNPVLNVTVDRNKYVEAVFGTTIGTKVIGGGGVLLEPSTALYPFGTTVKFTALPESGNSFAQWGASGAGTNSPLSFVVSNATPSVTAVFSTLRGGQSALTVIENGQGHVAVNPQSNVYNIGQTVTVTAVPDPRQDFVGWAGDASGTQNPLLVTMNQSKTITANFTTRPALRVGTPLEGLVEDGFRLTIVGEFGARYTVLGSTNLANWTVAGAITNTYGTVQFTDPNATNLSHQFYRLSDQ